MGSFKKYVCSRLPIFDPYFPCSSPSLEFLNGKLVSVFVNSKGKLWMFFTVVYIMTIKVFTYSSKKVKWKKIVYDFLIKKIFISCTRLKTEKLLANPKQVIRKNSVCCLKNQEFFSQRECTDSLDLPPPVCFGSLSKDLPASTTNILFQWPGIIMLNANNSEISPFINFIWEQHHHLAFGAIVRLIH